MASADLGDDVSTSIDVQITATSEVDTVIIDGTPDQKPIAVEVSNSQVDVAEPQISTAPSQQNEKNEGGKDDPKRQPSWKGEARLYCTKNGRPHSVLVDFGYSKCPKCEEDLTQPELISEKPAEKGGDEQEASSSPRVSFMIEYQDQGGNKITSEPWGKPFDLQSARGTKVKEPIFEVVTVLATTIPEDKYRFRSEVKDMMDEGILNNAKIGITLTGAKMVIKSAEIVEAISKAVAYYPSVDMEGDTITIYEPYPLIAHHIEQLETYGKSLQGSVPEEPTTQVASGQPSDQPESASANPQDTRADIDVLLDYVKKSTYKSDIRDEQSRYENGMTCTFRMLWLLFKPGDTVYSETGNSLAAYVVSRVEMDGGILSPSTRKDPYKIHMWCLDFDGRFVGRRTEMVTIPKFEGERAITSLKVFPCEYLDRTDEGVMRQRLEQHGKKWYESLVGRQVFHAGSLADSRNKSYHGRVYVDSVSYYSEEPSDAPEVGKIEDMGKNLPKCYCDKCQGQRPHPPKNFRWEAYDVLDPFQHRNLETDGSSEPPNHRYLLCNRYIWGLMLKSRTWARLEVANCKPPTPNTRAIEHLVMPEERKTMIKALVQRFTSDGTKSKGSKPWLADHMQNKGEGQIFLLHGGPGVGKTFCIAEYTGRPLLALTGGDIGTDENKAEENLAKWFKLSETWGAVMLIDEADVYLERRELGDLKRNSLVSVFLRCVEYYRGILFLTTNRVGTFDDAFMSRIHIVIAYENLGPNEKAKIWKQFFNKLSEDRQDMIVKARAKKYVLEEESLTKLDWNGREIRNAFQTAVALADYRFQQKRDKEDDDVPVLDQTDFEQVLDMTSQFKDYVEKVHGASMDERAFSIRARLASQQ
ncbi:hypothetical protein NPX13_g6491 [Xylaria arbuscula]|uniref:AAA+ ATPase domain-containing protein n=1 Tax=Xylaria arbuscula TaxID=114810 RepID=A0A9W8NCS4_9PEZI|nr:hypothetical protein NPX13_g6491 [Xylaria arbuscula]